jgi:DNA-binding MarR family transcriptional regulator
MTSAVAANSRSADDVHAPDFYAALTSRGEQLIARIFPEHAQVIADAMSGLTEEKKRQATALLRELGLHAAPAGEDTAA